MISKQYQRILGVIVGGLFAVGGFVQLLHFIDGAKADFNHNPYGYLDFCRLENDQTVLYGWVHDADYPNSIEPRVTLYISGTSGASYTLYTDRAGYRDDAINQYITSQYPGSPTGGTYGFRLAFANLYKGGNYGVSGTAINAGPGANQALLINNTWNADGRPDSHYFAGNVIPQACLRSQASPPPPPPQPQPQPQPQPNPQPQPQPQPNPQPQPQPQPNPVPRPPSAARPTPVPIAGQNPPPAPPPQVTPPGPDATEPVVGVSATQATIIVPAKDFTSVRLKYGPTQDSLGHQTEPQEVIVGNAQLSMSGLTPATQYFFQPVYVGADGQTREGTVRSFTTSGYSVTLLFVQSDNSPALNVRVRVPDINTEEITSETGAVSYENVSPGTYNIEYTYQEQSYTTSVTVPDSSNPSTDGYSVSTITIGQQTTAPNEESRRSSTALAAILFLLLLLPILAFVGWGFWKKRRRGKASSYDYDISTGYPSSDYTAPVVAPSSHKAAHSRRKPSRVPLPVDLTPAPHQGQSLREMVMESMQPQASKNPPAKHDDPYKDLYK